MFDRLFGRLGDAAQPLLWLCLVTGVNQLGFGIVSPILPLYANSFGVTETAIGLTVSVYGLGRLVMTLPSGQFADRWGRRSVLLGGTVVTAVGSLFCGLAPTFELFLLFRLIAGAGAGIVVTGAYIMLADISTPENRGRVMSLYQGWFVLAVGLGPAPGGLLAQYFGFRSPFYAFAALALLAGIVAWAKVPETRRRSTTTRSVGAGPRPNVWQVLTIPGVALAGLVMFSQSFSRTGGIFTIAPLDGSERLDLSPSQIGLAFSAGNLLMMATVAVAGPLIDRYGRKTIIVPSTLLSATAFLTLAWAPNYFGYLLGGALWGITAGLSGTAPAAYVADLAPKHAIGLAMGTYRMLGELGYLLGPAFLGFVAEQAGASTSLLTIAAMFIVAGMTFWIWAPNDRKLPSPGVTASQPG